MLNIYKASAGSGKTYTLTREYITLLLGKRNPDTGRWILNKRPCHAHRGILAITFTNKATDEMTARIISQLAILGGRDRQHPEPSDYEPELCSLFGTDPATLRALASETLDDLLFDFAYFHVSTIDAFFQTVLRTFAREVEVPDNYELELDNRYTISLGVGEMLGSINYREPADPLRRKRDQWLRSWLNRFMQHSLESGRAINLFSRAGGLQSTLVGMFVGLLDEKFKLNSETIASYLSDLNRLSAFEDGLRKRLARETDELASKAVALMQMADFPSVNNHIRKNIENWAQGLAVAPCNTALLAIDDIDKRYLAAYRKKGVIDTTLDDLLTDTLVTARDLQPLNEMMKIIPDAIMRMGLLGCVIHYLDELCKENNLILLSETGSILRDIISDDETPFVYERLGYYLNHFLIDEFQDTSRLQWENLRPMLMESLSRNEHDLIIGDEKQCIYRFRNSDPDLLHHQVAETITDTFGDGLTEIRGIDIEDNNNWRSSPEVVKFNNTVFRALAHLIGADSIYGSVIQRIPDRRLDKCGHVTLKFIERHSDPENSEIDDSSEGNAPLDGPISRQSVEEIVKDIDRLLSSGRQMRDIAILVRRHSEGQQIIERLLQLGDDPAWKHGKIEVTSSDAMEISRSSAVRLVIEVLRLALTPEYIPAIGNSANGSQTEEKKQLNPAWRRTRLTRWYQYFIHCPIDSRTGQPPTQNDAIANALDMIADPESLDPETIAWRDEVARSFSQDDIDEATLLRCPSLDTVIENIIARYVSPEVLSRDTVFITAFQDLVLDFGERHGNDIRTFIDWWDRTGRRKTLSSLPDVNAISVMTIHQSKGLEFPCVIIPSADWAMVSYHNAFRPSYGWYSIDPQYFPDIHPEVVPPFLPMTNDAKLAAIPMFAAEAKEYALTQSIDALNVAYVAFTRAVDELIVYAPCSFDKPSNTLGDLLLEAVSSTESFEKMPRLNDRAIPWVIDLQSHYDPETRTLEVGVPTAVKSRKVSVTDSSALLPDYVPGTNTEHTALSEVDIELFDYEDPRQRGNFIHGILSRLKTPQRLDCEVRRAAYRARLDSRQERECLETLRRALADPRVKPWMEGYRKVASERTLIDGKNERRADRIVWTADGHIDVIDFKTGAHEQKYARQVRDYVDILRRGGYENVRGFLWYVSDCEIVEVDCSNNKNLFKTDSK